MTTIHRSQQSKGWVFIVLLLGSVSAFDSDPEQGQHSATWPTSSEVAQPARDDVTETTNVISTSTMASSSPSRETRSAEDDGSATSLGNNTVLIPDTSAYSSVQLYALLVDVLEKLNILVPATASCYQLQKIVHEVLPDGASESGRAVGVSLFFRETPLSASPASSASTSGTNESSKADVTGSEEQRPCPHLPASNAVGVKNECTSSPDLIHSMNAQPLVRSELLNDTHGRRVDGSQEDANDTGVAGTDNQNEASGAFEYANNGKQESYLLGGLSRTQVVVISTCSAIIALFFLVAAILRVRNYIKRIREEQAMRERPTFRSCSVRLRSASQSNDHFRRDSQTSKLSHQVGVVDLASCERLIVG
ncbi:hypothetical protein C0Q70_03925 [Pomacea canaliculata]|uniref:Transmembrane protein n=1 Tax=Pomacea canaliculata TaxID=400727 RepID=A0A2T7PU31_POMCA|nr:hypothetical protein C0Q70_03925 [Pomacea canaliculata]